MSIENDWLYRKDTLPLRDALCEFLEEHYGKVRFLEEKTLGRVRADMIAVLPNAICGIEIKSHCDTYTRLDGQVRGYDRFCDFSYLCAADKHVHAIDRIPPAWGIISITVREGARFRIVRAPEEARRDVLGNQLSLLWRNELAEILRAEGLPKYTGKSKKFICDALLRRVPGDRLRARLCDALFERDYSLYSDAQT
ncbi:MAG: sce7726 family protein [Clostridia bacterium]|nr:sce7726 family protein [Clostridia bacterium]